MALKFTKMTLTNMKKLKPNERIVENNIVFTRLNNGDGRYEVYFRANGQRIHRVIGKESDNMTRSEVEKILIKLKNDACLDRFNMPKGRKLALSFKQAAAIYIERLRQESGKNIERKEQQIRDVLNPFFGTKPVGKIKSFDIERFKKDMVDRGYAQATANRHLAVFTHMMNKLVEWEMISNSPCKAKKFKEQVGRINYLTVEQINTVLENAKHSTCPFAYPFIFIGLNTSMRRSEILSIKIENIDLKNLTIFIPKAKAGARVQPITKELAEYLNTYIQNLKKDEVFLFPSKYSKTGHFINIDKSFKKIIEESGLDPKVIVRHTLRHTAISHLMQAGVDLSTIQAISGHKTVQMVMRYSHQNNAHIQEAMSKLENRYFQSNNVANIDKRA